MKACKSAEKENGKLKRIKCESPGQNINESEDIKITQYKNKSKNREDKGGKALTVCVRGAQAVGGTICHLFHTWLAHLPQ
jgi:hypothetical protein